MSPTAEHNTETQTYRLQEKERELKKKLIKSSHKNILKSYHNALHYNTKSTGLLFAILKTDEYTEDSYKNITFPTEIL